MRERELALMHRRLPFFFICGCLRECSSRACDTGVVRRSRFASSVRARRPLRVRGLLCFARGRQYLEFESGLQLSLSLILTHTLSKRKQKRATAFYFILIVRRLKSSTRRLRQLSRTFGFFWISFYFPSIFFLCFKIALFLRAIILL